MFLSTVVVPIVCTFLILLSFYLGITPKKDTPVAWVLTNKRFIQIHLDHETAPSMEIDLEDMIDVDVIPTDWLDSSGVHFLADVFMIFFQLVFHFIRDLWKRKKTEGKYWANGAGIEIKFGENHVERVLFSKDKHTRNIGPILSLALEKGWEECVVLSEFPAVRTSSKLK